MSSNDRPSETQGVAPSEMLARLGLDADASVDEVAAAHDAVIRFLASAPRDMGSWARTQATAADEAYAYLSDPTASRGLDALVGSERDSRSSSGGSDESTARRTAADEGDGDVGPEGAADPGDVPPSRPADSDDVDAVIASVTPSAHRDAVGKPAEGSAAAPAGSPAPSDGQSGDDEVGLLASNRTLKRAVAILAGIILIVVVGVGVYSIGTPPDSVPSVADAGVAEEAPQPTFDAVKVAGLMARIQDDPADSDALVGLGDEYFTIGDFDTAAEWFDRALAQEPENVNAYLALGAAHFNQGDLDGAEMQWLEAVRRDPENLEGYYDLGWVYLNRTPPDMGGLERVWGEVIRLAPDSEVAETVKAHLDALDDTDAGPIASGSPVSAPAATPAATPAEPGLASPAPAPDVSAAP